MSEKQKILQYLHEAHATEMTLVRELESQLAVTPRGNYQRALGRHYAETREHARRVEKRIGELGDGPELLQSVIGVGQVVLSQGLALGKLPLNLLRGHGGAEKVLKNAKDAAASEALEIATYTAIEELANAV